MGSAMCRRIAIAASTGAVISSQLTPATARSDLHNITYVARVDGVAPGSTDPLNGVLPCGAPLPNP